MPGQSNLLNSKVLLAAAYLASTLSLASTLAGCGNTVAPVAERAGDQSEVSTTRAAAQPARSSGPAEVNRDATDSPQENSSSESMAVARQAFASLLAAAQSTDPTAWTPAEEAMQALGPAAVPALVEQLDPSKQLACELAVMSLAQLGPAAEPAAEQLALLVNLKTCSASIRANAAATLSIWEQYHEEVIPALLELLTAKEPSVRITSAIALGQIPAKASRTIQPLCKLLTDTDPQVRIASARALGSLGEAAKPIIAQLEQIRQDEHEGVRQAATQSIQQITRVGPATSDTIPASATK